MKCRHFRCFTQPSEIMASLQNMQRNRMSTRHLFFKMWTTFPKYKKNAHSRWATLKRLWGLKNMILMGILTGITVRMKYFWLSSQVMEIVCCFFSGRTFIIAPFDTIDGIDDTKSVLFSLTDNQLKSMNWMRPQEMGSFSCDGKYVGIVIGKEV